MDLSKAVDGLPHRFLVAQLYEFSYTACQLIAGYLCERRQRLKASNAHRKRNTLCKRISQGSISSPLLFNMLINDLFYFVDKCKLYNYADDSSTSHAALTMEEVCRALEHDGNIAIDWYESNGIHVNPSKFQMTIMFSSSTEPISVTLKGNIVLTSESCVKV